MKENGLELTVWKHLCVSCYQLDLDLDGSVTIPAFLSLQSGLNPTFIIVLVLKFLYTFGIHTVAFCFEQQPGSVAAAPTTIPDVNASGRKVVLLTTDIEIS